MEMTEGTAKALVSILTSLNGTLARIATALEHQTLLLTQEQIAQEEQATEKVRRVEKAKAAKA